MKVSSCCGAAVTNPMMLDYGICPDCKDHCEFEDYDSDDEDSGTVSNANSKWVNYWAEVKEEIEKFKRLK
jgi:hypothetical protein